jgi:hypothetical protein
LISIGCNDTNIGMRFVETPLYDPKPKSAFDHHLSKLQGSMIFQALKRAAGRDTTVTGGGCVKLSMSHRQIRFGNGRTFRKLFAAPTLAALGF